MRRVSQLHVNCALSLAEKNLYKDSIGTVRETWILTIYETTILLVLYFPSALAILYFCKNSLIPWRNLFMSLLVQFPGAYNDFSISQHEVGLCIQTYMLCVCIYMNSHIHMDLCMCLCASSSAYTCIQISMELGKGRFTSWQIQVKGT